MVSHWETLVSALPLAALEAAREPKSHLSSPRASSTCGSSSAGAAADPCFRATNGGGGGDGGCGAWGWDWGLGLGLARGGALPFGACSAYGSASSAGACHACLCASRISAISAWVAAFCSTHGSVLAEF